MIALLGRYGAPVRVPRARERARRSSRSPALALRRRRGRSRRRSGRSRTRPSTTSTSTASYADLLADGQLPYLRLRLRVPAAGGAAAVAGGRCRARRGDVRVTLRACSCCVVRARRPAARARALAGRRARDASSSRGCSRSRRSSSARRCARTSTLLPIAIALGALLALRPRPPGARLRAARRRHDDEALPRPARGRRVRVAAAAAASARAALRGARDLRRGRARDLAAVRRRRLRRLVHVPPRPAGADRVDARDACCSRSATRTSPGTNLRPDRFKSNGLDGGHADRGRSALFALLLVARAGVRSSRSPRGAATPRHLVLCGFAALLAFVDARQGLLAAVRHLARAVRGARAGPGAQRARRGARRRARSC